MEADQKIYELIETLDRLNQLLTSDDFENRENEVVNIIESLQPTIEVSSEFLSDRSRAKAYELRDVLSRFSDYSTVYRSAQAILRCIDKSNSILDKQPQEYEVTFELKKTYSDFKYSVISRLRQNFNKMLSIVRETNLQLVTSSLYNETLGDLLEKFYVPKLVEKMDYQLKSRIVPTSLGEIEVDIRAEKDTNIGWENLEKHKKREVLIVEVKTTVSKDDIKSLSKKSEAINENYEKESEIWKNNFKSETWMVSVYGWTPELKEFARNLDIKPIDQEELENLLQKFNLLHKGRRRWRRKY